MGFEAQSESTPLTPEQEEQLKGIALTRAPKDLAAAEAAKTEEELFYALPSAAVAAFRLGNVKRARQLAERALELAPPYKTNWNYGNAVHAAHTVFGLVALSEGTYLWPSKS